MPSDFTAAPANMAAPLVETHEKRELKLSSKKKLPKALAKPKKRVLRNLFVKPYEDFWPEITQEEEECLSKAFQKLVEEENNIVNMKPEEKELRASKRKKWSEVLVYGINNVPRCVKKGSVIAVLIAADVDPKFLVQHVITLCGATEIPVLIVSSLRIVTKKLLGFSSIAVGIKKIVAESSTNSLHEIYEFVKKTAEHHKPMAEIRQFAQGGYESIDPEPEEPPDSSEETHSAVVPATDVYLYRASKESRVFVPKSQKSRVSDTIEVNQTEQKIKLEDFLSLGDSDDSMDNTDAPIKGISFSMVNLQKTELKRKQHSFPEYVPFKYMKVQPNPNKKQY